MGCCRAPSIRDPSLPETPLPAFAGLDFCPAGHHPPLHTLLEVLGWGRGVCPVSGTGQAAGPGETWRIRVRAPGPSCLGAPGTAQASRCKHRCLPTDQALPQAAARAPGCPALSPASLSPAPLFLCSAPSRGGWESCMEGASLPEGAGVVLWAQGPGHLGARVRARGLGGRWALGRTGPALGGARDSCTETRPGLSPGLPHPASALPSPALAPAGMEGLKWGGSPPAWCSGVTAQRLCPGAWSLGRGLPSELSLASLTPQKGSSPSLLAATL